MTNFALMLGTVLIICVLAALTRGWLRDRERRTMLEQRRVSTAYERRLAEPDWEAAERYLGRPVPAALRALYEDATLVQRSDFLVRDPRDAASGKEWEIGDFHPAGDEQPDWPEKLGIPARSFCFAWTRSGDPYFMLPSDAPDGDGPVQLAIHDGGEVLDVAPSLSAFHAWARTSD